MQVAIVTVGDELLAGDTENTNASWLARQLAGRGAAVARILTVPDDGEAIADAVRSYRERFDAVVVTGGLGGTHDDMTMAAVADAVDRELVVDGTAREQVVETAAAFQDANPELVETYDLQFDPDAWAERPAGARVVRNDAGLAPGCVVESGCDGGEGPGADSGSAGDGSAPVYVLPGPPEELRAVFERVADEFGGDRVTETVHTPAPESALVSHIEALRDAHDVVVGSYPDTGAGHNRVTVSAEDPDEVAAAVAWLRERVDVVEPEGG